MNISQNYTSTSCLLLFYWDYVSYVYKYSVSVSYVIRSLSASKISFSLIYSKKGAWIILWIGISHQYLFLCWNYIFIGLFYFVSNFHFLFLSIQWTVVHLSTFMRRVICKNLFYITSTAFFVRRSIILRNLKNNYIGIKYKNSGTYWTKTVFERDLFRLSFL